MAQPRERLPDAQRYCAYCGNKLDSSDRTVERFGERFCSEAHAASFSDGRDEARRRTDRGTSAVATSSRSSRGVAGRPWLWVVSVIALVFVAVPFFGRGGWSGVGFGSGAGLVVLLLLLLVVCPLSMYFMMRGMGDHHDDKRKGRREE